jgi:hypothetical protein
MALRNVTLTGTTIGSGISNVSIYHSFVDPSNLIQAGVTSTQLANGYTFQDQDYRYTYYVVSDSACGTNTRVVLPNAPISTFTEGQIVDISDNVITHDITAIGNTITGTQNDWMIFTEFGSTSNGHIVRSDDNGQTWIKESSSSAPDRAMAFVNNSTKSIQGGVSYPVSVGSWAYNAYGYFTSNGGSNWSQQNLMTRGTVNSSAYNSGYVGYSFQDVQTRTTAEGTQRDGHNKFVSYLGAQWMSTTGQYFSTDYSYSQKSHIDEWLNSSSPVATWQNRDSNVSASGVSQSLRGYGCRLTDETGLVKIFAGASSGYMLKITVVNTFTAVSSGESGTNQLITAVGHNQEELNEHGQDGSETTWLAAIEDPNQAANTQEFIMSTDDGDNWVSYTGTNMDTDYIYDIKYIKGRWYAVGKKGTEGRICSTADLNDPWEQMGTTKPCKTIGVGRDIENTKIIIGCEEGYIVQNQV